ncbi:MAG: 3-phosphoshikimate 1-carboxyvinyltransferase [Steroidobacter sp.]
MTTPSYFCQPGSTIGGEISVPGDKSVSHRSLMLGGIAEGTTEVRGFLESEDCLATLAALRALGVNIARYGGNRVTIQGVGMDGFKAPAAPLDMGNAGTAMRLSMGLLAGQKFESTLVGDASLMKRPMERVAKPLREMGAQITTQNGLPPVVIHGGHKLHAIDYNLPMASAQVKSAVLLAGLYAQGRTAVIEPAVTRDHTERMLLSFGCRVDAAHGEVVLTPPDELKACSLEVPGDFSSAAFFMVAGSINPKKDAVLTIMGVGVNPTRTGLLDILALMGADLRVVNHRNAGAEPVADIEVRPAQLQGIHVPEHLVPLAIDEFPVLFVAAACAEGETVVTGAEELRVKESDRIAVMAEGLKAMGVECEVLKDGIRIQGKAAAGTQVFSGGTVDSHGDHRIAMSFSVASLRSAAPIKVLDVANVATSFPDFPGTAGSAGLNVRVRED